MNTLLLGVRVLLFALSTFGYLTFAHRKTRISVDFLPALVFTGQICILFFAGLLNLLPLAVPVLFLTGLFLSLGSLRCREQYRDFVTPALIFFALACLYFLLLLKGVLFTGYDNFSHWALVVKQMLQTDRFPTWQDPIILFQGYPLGSSVFIYYVSRLISTVSEGCQMFAQTMLTISLILPVFSGIRKRKLPGFLLLLGASLFFLSYIATPDSLYVDTLLPLCGAFGFLLLNRELEADEHTAWLTVLPAAAVIMIKNSGIFFWALIAGRVLIYWIRHRKTASSMQRRSWLTVMLFPLFSLLAWNRHVAYVFTSAESSPHSMSLSVYLANIQAKLADGTIPQITRAFLLQVLHGRILLLLLAVLLLAALYARFQKLPRPAFGRLALFLVLVYAAYQLGSLCMYLFSMPEGEALVMAGYPRYYGSIAIFCLAIALYHFGKWMDTVPVPTAFIFTFVFLFVFCLMGANPRSLLRHSGETQRDRLEALIQEYGLQPDSACLVYVPADDSGYTYHLVKYALYTATVDVHNSSDGEDISEVVETARDLGYDYLICFDTENDELNLYCAEMFGVPEGTPVIALQ